MFYGWVILWIAGVATFATSPGLAYLVGKFNASIEGALGISETTLTAAFGIATFAAAIPLLYVGKLADRYGPRIVMGLSAAVLGVACWVIGTAQGPVSLALCYFILRLSGQVLGLSASHSTAMWFERKLGTATGLKMFAMPLAIVVLPVVTSSLISTHGWRIAFGVLGVGVWMAVLPLVIFLHRDKPEDIGQRVDGDPFDDPEPDVHPRAHPDAELIAAGATVQPLAIDLVEEDAAPDASGITARGFHAGEVCFTRAEAMRTSAYWIITVAVSFNTMVGISFVFLLAKMAGAIGLDAGADDRLLVIFGIATAVFGLIAGVLTDRIAARWIIGSAAALLGVSCALFALAGNGEVREVQGGVWALASGAMVALAASQTLMYIGGSTFLARFFGRPHHGAIRASLTFFIVIGTSAGPFLTATIAQGVGYGGALWVYAGVCVPVVVAGTLLRRPEPASVTDGGDCLD